MSEHIIKNTNTKTLTNKRTDWQAFKLNLTNRIDLMIPLISKNDIEKEVHKLVSDIQKSAWESTPGVNRTITKRNYPKEIKDLVADKRRARRTWQKTRAPQHKAKLNNLCQQLRREIRKFKEGSMKRYLRGLTAEYATNYSLWKATKGLKQPIVQIPPIKATDGNWARSDEDKAILFADYLESIFKPPDENENRQPMLIEPSEEESEEILPTTPNEIRNLIKYEINAKKSPGYDLISGDVLKNLPRKAIIKITNLINATFKLKFVPSLWKVADVLMIPKPGKPPNIVSSYRPISLLPMISKVFEKVLAKRLNKIIERKKLIPNHQFGFRRQHSTIQQVHRITNKIEVALEERKVCSAVFLDVAQAFDKVWHEGLIYKLRCMLPNQYASILKSYLDGRHFRIKQQNTYSKLREIKAGVPQGSVLGPILFLLYTSDIPELENHTMATFADDTAILAVGRTNEESTEKLQIGINKICEWTTKWRIKLNESKSVHIDFTNKKVEHIPIIINQKIVPYANTAKYLGMTLDAKLRWKEHIKKKKKELEIKYRKLHWLIGRNSTVSIGNKVLLYNQILKPTWTYGIQLWGCAKKTNVDIIQRFQNKVLRNIVNAPWFIRNTDLHRDLKVESVNSEILKHAKKHKERLKEHVNLCRCKKTAE